MNKWTILYSLLQRKQTTYVAYVFRLPYTRGKLSQFINYVHYVGKLLQLRTLRWVATLIKPTHARALWHKHQHMNEKLKVGYYRFHGVLINYMYIHNVSAKISLTIREWTFGRMTQYYCHWHPLTQLLIQWTRRVRKQ